LLPTFARLGLVAAVLLAGHAAVAGLTHNASTDATTAGTTINNFVAANTWVGSPTGSVTKALTSCTGSTCAGWLQPYSAGVNVYTSQQYDHTDSSGAWYRDVTYGVLGMIRAAYTSFGSAGATGPNSYLGFPTTAELDTPNWTGKWQGFQGGRMYYKWGTSSAYEVNGWILSKWNTLGATQSLLGFPTSNELNYSNGSITGGKISYFENGAVIWDGTVGTWWDDTWPVMTAAPANPTARSTWVVGRVQYYNASGRPAYEIYGCGFDAYAPIDIHANGTLGRGLLGSTNAMYNGCVHWTTPPVASSYGSSLVTIDVDDGPLLFDSTGYHYGHDAVTGLRVNDGVCTFTDPVYGQRQYYRVYDSTNFTWCVAPETWNNRHDEMMGGTANGYNFTFPDDALAQVVSFLGPYQGGHLKIRVNEDINGFYAGSGGEIGVEGATFDNHWAHVGIVQEIVNSFTGSFGGLWPRDWWADHKSPFPTFINWNVLQGINLPDDSYAYELDLQHGPGPNNNDPANRDYDPYMASGSHGQWDPQLMIFQRLQEVGGWSVYKNMFQYMRGDGIDLDYLMDPPTYTVQSISVNSGVSKQTSEYVAAYLSLGYRHNLGTPAGGDTVDANGIWTLGHWNVGGRPYIWVYNNVKQDCWLEFSDGSDAWGCASANYTDADGNLVLANTRPWTGYTVEASHVTSIADAHCRIAATYPSNPTLANAASSRLEIGDYNGALSTLGSAGACGSACPSECGCYLSHCSAPWH
jgi:hypothetical protein